jgi:hypothetical protein
MAGEIQLNSTSFASESGGTITINNATVGSAVAMSANQACVKTAINASGSAPIYACRAWINFDGTSASIGTGRANGNVSGVSDNGTGDYTVTFATAMPDANYCVTASTGGNVLGVSGHAPANGHTLATGSMRVSCGTSSANADPSFVHFAVFR